VGRFGTTIDAVCYAFDATSQMPFVTDATYTCEGMPVSNLPHDNTASAASNASAAPGSPVDGKDGRTVGQQTLNKRQIAVLASGVKGRVALSILHAGMSAGVEQRNGGGSASV
jgi:hypothetical protein